MPNGLKIGIASALVVLLVLFVTMRIMGFIAWSFLWVLAPLWVPLCIIFLVSVLTVAIVGNRD